MIFVERHDRPDPSPPAAVAAELGGAEQLDFPSARHPGWRVTLHRKPDRWNGFARLPRGWLHVASPLGLDCFAALRKILADAPVTGLQGALGALEHIRPCAFVAYDADSEKLHFGRSMDGFGSLYFGGESGRLLVSDSRLRVAHSQGEVCLSEVDREMWCIRSALSPEGSFFEGVKRCFAGVRYESAQGRQFAHRVMAPEGRPLSQEASVQFLEDELLEAFAGYGDRRVALRLSGGVDSRTLLVAMLDAVRRGILRKEQILCVSVLFPGLDCDEGAAIREVVKLADVEWVGIEATVDRIGEVSPCLMRSESPPFPTSFVGALCLDEARKRGAGIMCSGHGGDEVLDYGFTDLLAAPLPWRIRHFHELRAWRNPDESFHYSKAMIGAIFGLPASGVVRRGFARLPFRRALASAYRPAQRYALAEGMGYESAGHLAIRSGLDIDVPFFRQSFFARFAPFRWMQEDGFKSKVVACSFMLRQAPLIARVDMRKVVFDTAVNSLQTSSERGSEDGVDRRFQLRYRRKRAYDEWRTCLSEREST